ncbi:hypothetical protein IQ266_21220 [filamentous cyanobacterium LEGE 11480]|uniref:Uncharacterized protein n=1 Tax=Romeriopsis navalis LEGE 11480 TaxID=2777977 RepID=A0A928VU43_9CYAN|nr:hypothetical protein [Romeriopsis navalis]MBE9032264.1 hypothetical protein [Romeriopsis navalis LEGE 11480]
MLSLDRAVFTAEKFDGCFNLADLNALVEESCRTAIQHPKAFYLFMQRYVHFNGHAGSLVARLASSIGLSRELFLDPNSDVFDQSDRGMEIAARVLAATIDEHSDQHGKGFSHRTLAQATLKSTGDYANLTSAERNELGQIPAWFADLMQEFAQGYQGQPGSLEALVKGMGFHAASEVLADREYVAIDRIVRHENKNSGYDAYLRDGNGRSEIDGRQIGAWYWVAVHGSHTQAGVELEHFDEALSAINLAVRYLPANNEISQWVFEGFSQFATIQQNFFREVNRECLELIKRELNESMA